MASVQFSGGTGFQRNIEELKRELAETFLISRYWGDAGFKGANIEKFHCSMFKVVSKRWCIMSVNFVIYNNLCVYKNL